MEISTSNFVCMEENITATPCDVSLCFKVTTWHTKEEVTGQNYHIAIGDNYHTHSKCIIQADSVVKRSNRKTF